MKKIVMVVVSLMAMVMLVACGGNKEKSPTAPTPSKPVQMEEKTQTSNDLLNKKTEEQSSKQIKSDDKNADQQSEKNAAQVTPAIQK